MDISNVSLKFQRNLILLDHPEVRIGVLKVRLTERKVHDSKAPSTIPPFISRQQILDFHIPPSPFAC